MYGRLDFDEECMGDRYLKHNKEVLEYFKDRPSDLLVMDTNKPSLRDLARFLEQDFPERPYPWKNKSASQSVPATEKAPRVHAHKEIPSVESWWSKVTGGAIKRNHPERSTELVDTGR
jgi:hypothetical protein